MAETERLDKKIEVWGNIKVLDEELDEYVFKPGKIKDKPIWCKIIPQTGSLQKQQADTILSNTTHKIKVRYGVGKDLTQDMWFIFKEGNIKHRFDIKYILDPYFAREFLEIFCEEIIGG
ncbi:phage head closure protein [Clostridium beijerinckii]|uniref:phage head closure protein n=1 Tax=Clostridium beijerinckii TaxID=1520 RepID=UPI0014946A17|nr:phage head closure protein [Clostridium beijerinckii]NOW07853.1 SPP1 family predicted phage head-tail adaptor [Clostridium beijerinckii]NYC05484.1 SPP1 family predicted phage head-tail adaptor [Clostridium beijerinckii]